MVKDDEKSGSRMSPPDERPATVIPAEFVKGMQKPHVDAGGNLDYPNWFFASSEAQEKKAAAPKAPKVPKAAKHPKKPKNAVHPKAPKAGIQKEARTRNDGNAAASNDAGGS